MCHWPRSCWPSTNWDSAASCSTARHSRSTGASSIDCCAPAVGIAIRQIPTHITDDRLLGGIDLGGSLARGEIVTTPGLLTTLSGGVAALPFAGPAVLSVVPTDIALDANQAGEALSSDGQTAAGRLRIAR